jgi:ABC-type amino acid transport substrate-binding protein
VDFLDLYIPANPFSSMARAVVPAIVVFSIALGVALIGIERKGPLLEVLEVVRSALDRVTGFVVRLAPLGVFALMASAAGTLDLADLGRIEVYIVVYTAVALVLVFWVLPVLVATLTPLRYSQVLGPVRDALVTAFATGNLLIVLPILADRGKKVLADAGVGAETSESAVDVLVPASFTIPNMGKLLSLAFVPFAGWFTGFELAPSQYPLFATVGFASFFGEPVVSLPFLLSLLRIPADTFELFVTIDVITSRFGTLLAAAHTVVLALLAAFVMSGQVRIRWPRLAVFAAGSAALLMVTILGARALFTYGREAQYTGYRDFIEMEPVTGPLEARELDALPAPLPPGSVSGQRLELIEKRGSLRVGYFADALPRAFRNARGRLVGFDIEMAQLLARELDVELELVRIERSDVSAHLEDGRCDLVVSGAVIAPEAARFVRFSKPVRDLTLAFVVPQERRDAFTEWNDLRRWRGLTLGLGPSPYYRRLLESLLPDARIVSLSSSRDFFTQKRGSIDALVIGAEVGSAWTLVYPRYAVAVPRPDRIAVPEGYAMPHGEVRLHDVVDAFISLKISDGTTRTLFEHWFEGRSPTRHRRRWSIVHDVLGWL